jgi:hypothetical protein
VFDFSKSNNFLGLWSFISEVKWIYQNIMASFALEIWSPVAIANSAQISDASKNIRDYFPAPMPTKSFCDTTIISVTPNIFENISILARKLLQTHIIRERQGTLESMRQFWETLGLFLYFQSSLLDTFSRQGNLQPLRAICCQQSELNREKCSQNEILTLHLSRKSFILWTFRRSLMKAQS